jgi:hypothetical protein
MKTTPSVIVALLCGALVGWEGRDVSGRLRAVQQNVQQPRTVDKIYAGGDTPRTQKSRLNRVTGEALPLADIKAALDGLKEARVASVKADRLCALVLKWGKIDSRGAFDYVESLSDSDLKAGAMTALAGLLAETDPRYLREEASVMTNSRSRRIVVEKLANNLADQDLHTALAWTQELPEDICKRDALAIIYLKWSREKPEEASTQISQITAGDTRSTLIASIAENWALQDPMKALDWALKLEGNESVTAISSLAGTWAKKDPAEASYFASQLPEGELKNRAVMALVASWADRNPQAASAWTAQLPEGYLREQSVREVVSAWTRLDFEEARGWAMNLSDPATKDTALKSYAENIAYWAPGKAAAVIDSIVDQGKKQESIEATMRAWLQIDRDAAQKWLAQLQVSDDVKQRMQAL